MRIDRGEFIRVAAHAVVAFSEMDFLDELPHNIKIKACEELANGYMKALQIANYDKKPAGEIKTSLLNFLRDESPLNLDVEQPDNTLVWEDCAWDAYQAVYSSRFNTAILLQATSRLMRGLSLFNPLPPSTPAIHYQPDKTIVDRFYTKVLAADFPDPSEPSSFTDGSLKDLDGATCRSLGGLVVLNISQYRQGTIAKIHNERSN